MQKTFLVLLLFMGIRAAQASDTDSTVKTIAVQMDMFDFMAKGFSVWGVYTHGQNRFFLDGGRNELPDFLNPDSEFFYETRSYFVQGGYYRLLSKPSGLFIGVEAIYQQMEIEYESTQELSNNVVVRVGPVVGYEIKPFKHSASNISIVPWISERIPVVNESVAFVSTEQTYTTATFNFVMGCNVSLAFDIGKKQ